MVSLLLRIARIAGFCLLAVLALWFSPLWLSDRIGRLGGFCKSSEPEVLHCERLKAEKRRRYGMRCLLRKWEKNQREARFKRIEKTRNNFYN